MSAPSFDPNLSHLSLRAVEWLRAKTWRLDSYRQPASMPACWGRMHPNWPGLEVPRGWKTWAKTGNLNSSRRRREGLPWAAFLVQPADMRAFVRCRTPGASSRKYVQDVNGHYVQVRAALPTCPTCAVLADKELSETTQQWVEPPEWTRAKERSQDLTLGITDETTFSLVDPKSGKASPIVTVSAAPPMSIEELFEAGDDVNDSGRGQHVDAEGYFP